MSPTSTTPSTETTTAPHGRRARKVLDRAPRFRGWATTDEEEEVERRRQRGATEPLQVQVLEPEHPVFGTFRVGTAGGNAGDGPSPEDGQAWVTAGQQLAREIASVLMPGLH